MKLLANRLAVLAFVPFGLSTVALGQGGPPPQVLPEGIRGGSEVVPEQGVEIRNYVFEPTGEHLPFSVYVSSKVRNDRKAPLIIALRGFTGTTLTFVRGTAVDLAEAGGYILVGVIGYNNRAGFGVQARPRPAPAAAVRIKRIERRPLPRTLPPLVGGTAETDPAKVTAYSEQDVMNVLALVRKEFNIDDRRIYLMGHSQGGGGARHLAEKYSDTWTAVALLAPALFHVQVTAESKIARVPLAARGRRSGFADHERPRFQRAARSARRSRMSTSRCRASTTAPSSWEACRTCSGSSPTRRSPNGARFRW